MVFLSPSKQKLEQYLQTSNYSFLLDPYKHTIHNHSAYRRYIKYVVEGTSLDKLRNIFRSPDYSFNFDGRLHLQN
jgi:hypothetical protein